MYDVPPRLQAPASENQAALGLRARRLIYTEEMTLLPQQNALLISPQQTIIVKVTILLVTVTTVIAVVTIHVVVTIEIVTTTILVC